VIQATGPNPGLSVFQLFTYDDWKINLFIITKCLEILVFWVHWDHVK
jgi:hypothetical protein